MLSRSKSQYRGKEQLHAEVYGGEVLTVVLLTALGDYLLLEQDINVSWELDIVDISQSALSGALSTIAGDAVKLQLAHFLGDMQSGERAGWLSWDKLIAKMQTEAIVFLMVAAAAGAALSRAVIMTTSVVTTPILKSLGIGLGAGVGVLAMEFYAASVAPLK